MQHFYDSFALMSQICVRRDALVLFGLHEDELLPDLHITRAGVLRIGMGAHQERVVNQDAQAADRTKVPAEVIQVASHEIDTDSDNDKSIVATSGSEQSASESESEQDDPPSSLASDAEQYENMQVSYAAVGRDFHDQEAFLGSAYHKLQRLEMVPQRWPLATLSFSLQKCVDHLDRVLAGCCWEVHATRADPKDSVSSLRQVWFPAHCAPVVLQQLQHKEDEYRTAHPSWMDQEVAPVDIKKQWQEARANPRMQFKLGNYRDGDTESNIRMLTGTIKADWIQLPVERYLEALPTVKQGVISGVFKIKGSSPWASTRAEKLQVLVFLPSDLTLDQWYAEVYALPTVWPDVSMLGASNLRRVSGYDFHHIRKKYDVVSMWGGIHPQWKLLRLNLEAKGPGWYSLAEREERLFTNRSTRPGDDMKDELRNTSYDQLWQLRQPAPPLVFPGEHGIVSDMYTQVREEEQVIHPQFIGSQQDVSKSRKKKRKQADDDAATV
eukprot:symbB.v1.2.022582.t1/scaffold1981.1/size93869/5